MTCTRAFLLVAPLLVQLVVPAQAAFAEGEQALPKLDGGDLAHGPLSAMHMVLKKTILRVNVANVDVRFDGPTQARFGDLLRGKTYSDAMAGDVANGALGAGRALFLTRFNRDVSLDRWMGVVRDNVEKAREAGLINTQLEQRVSQSLPQWFATLRDRGYHEGDKLIYSVSANAMRTVVMAADGQVLLERVDNEPNLRRVVLASYFAPGTDTRDPLLRSLPESK